MKKTLLLITLLASFLFAGQKQIINLSDSDRDIITSSIEQFEIAAQQTATTESKLGSAIVVKLNGEKERHTYTYTTHSYNQWATYTVEIWLDNSWVNYLYTEYYYNDNGRFIGGLAKNWQNGSWVDMIRYNITYNADNLAASSKSEMFYNNEWSVLSQSTITYGDNYSVEETESSFFGIIKERETDYYDSNDNTVSIMNELWEEEKWAKKDSTAIEYNSDNNPTIEVYYARDLAGWSEGDHLLYSYDDNKNRILELTKQYDGASYVNSYQRILTFDANNYLTEILEQSYSISEWINYIRYSYNYTSEGVSLHGICEYWDSSENKWTDSDGEFHIFDTKGWYTDYGTHGQSYLFDGHELNAEYDGVTAIRYTNNIVSDFSLSKNYPNPFNPSTKFSFTIQKSSTVNIAVYNIAGQQVAALLNETKASGTYEMTWNAANFGSGVYFIQLNANGKILTQKCILLK